MQSCSVQRAAAATETTCGVTPCHVQLTCLTGNPTMMRSLTASFSYFSIIVPRILWLCSKHWHRSASCGVPPPATPRTARRLIRSKEVVQQFTPPWQKSENLQIRMDTGFHGCDTPKPTRRGGGGFDGAWQTYDYSYVSSHKYPRAGNENMMSGRC